jgi:hypothetical protein
MFRPQFRLGLRGIVVVAALMLNGGNGLAAEVDPHSANFIMPGCREDLAGKSNWSVGLCDGLIAGLIYANRNICEPDGVTHRQEVRVVAQYIDARPARMHEDFRTLALEALKAAWPCSR